MDLVTDEFCGSARITPKRIFFSCKSLEPSTQKVDWLPGHLIVSLLFFILLGGKRF